MYSRTIDDQILTLSASGWTYFSTFVLYDYQTESLWHPVSEIEGLTCVSGKFVDRQLKEINSRQTTWSTWISENPTSKYMQY